jgi:hypothetical protein
MNLEPLIDIEGDTHVGTTVTAAEEIKPPEW